MPRPKLKVIVAGGRDFNDYELLKSILEKGRLKLENDDYSMVIISGMAKGADQLGERYAKEMGLELIQMPADWDKYGKGAGYRRNTEMATEGDYLVAFWNGVSKGTSHMINTAKTMGIDTTIQRY